jgi:hypothetical protein
MTKRTLFGAAVAGILLGTMGGAAHAQEGAFRISPPVAIRAAGPYYTVRWTDTRDGEIADGLHPSITWYYATLPDGSDRQRMVTGFRDDFSTGTFRTNWRPPDGPFGLDWIIRRERGERMKFILAGPADAGIACPLVSQSALDRDIVVSALVRPRGLRGEFGFGLRVQPTGVGYEVRTTSNSIQILHQGKPITDEKRILDVLPRNWYWYEVGICTMGGRRANTVDIRVRVLDEKRQRVLADLPYYGKCEKDLLKAGFLALWGSADFAEVCVDPWEARWVDDNTNSLKWDTSQVPDGSYYVVAELVDERNPSRLVVSDFQVMVRNKDQANNN